MRNLGEALDGCTYTGQSTAMTKSVRTEVLTGTTYRVLNGATFVGLVKATRDERGTVGARPVYHALLTGTDGWVRLAATTRATAAVEAAGLAA